MNRDTIKLIRELSRYKAQKRRKILQKAPRELIAALSEGSLNLLKGNVPLSRQKYTRLKRYKKNVHLLANPRTPLHQKRRIVEQRGGFLSLLASVLVPVLSGVISSAISSR